jgi:hypothetical protein
MTPDAHDQQIHPCNILMQTDPSKAAPPKRKRRWFQFSLRTLLIAVTLLAARHAPTLRPPYSLCETPSVPLARGFARR